MNLIYKTVGELNRGMYIYYPQDPTEMHLNGVA